MIVTTLSLPFCTFRSLSWLARKVWAPYLTWVPGGRMKVYGKENIIEGQNYIFISNHKSFLDIPLLYIATNRNLRFMAKEELLKNPLLGGIMRKVKVIPVKRTSVGSAAESLKHANEALQNGADIVVFPEGTRAQGEEIQPFKKGAFQLAQHSEALLLPIAIKNSQKVWPRNNFGFKSGEIIVNIGKPYAITEKSDKLQVHALEAKKIIEDLFNEV